MDNKGLIEVFTSGCPACEGTVRYASELAADGAHELRVWNVKDPSVARDAAARMGHYGIHELPAIVVDGELLVCCA